MEKDSTRRDRAGKPSRSSKNVHIDLERSEPQFNDAEISSFATYMVAQFDWQSEPIEVLMVTLRRLANIARYSERPADVQDAVTLINHQLFVNSETAPDASHNFEARARDRYETLLKGGN
jgi:hypothetical protein